MELRQRVFDALEYGDTTDCAEIELKYNGNPKTIAECMAHLANVFYIGGRDGLNQTEIIVHATDWFRSKQKRKAKNG